MGIEKAERAEWRATTRVRPYYDDASITEEKRIIVGAYPGGRPLQPTYQNLG